MAAETSGEAVLQLLVAQFGVTAFQAAAETVKPLLELRTAAATATGRLAHARSAELALRALALAEATLPGDSLVTVNMHKCAGAVMVGAGVTPEQLSGVGSWAERLVELHDAAWHDDPRLVAHSRRGLEILGSRWRAGTLSTLSAEERLYFAATPDLRARGATMRLWTFFAAEAVAAWPPAALDATALRDVKDAVCALLEADTRGELPTAADVPQGATLVEDPTDAVLRLCDGLLGGARRSVRTKAEQAQLLRDSGLSQAQAEALEGVRKRLRGDIYADFLRSDMDATLAANKAAVDSFRGNALATTAAQLAKHGLQRCTLPSCAAQEPVPRTYKRCGRCHAVFYCCAEHSKADWKRHKREDGCKASAEGST